MVIDMIKKCFLPSNVSCKGRCVNEICFFNLCNFLGLHTNHRRDVAENKNLKIRKPQKMGLPVKQIE